MAPCFGRLKVAGTPSFFRRNLPQPLARQGKSNSRPRERKIASIRRKRRDLGEKKPDFGKLERKMYQVCHISKKTCLFLLQSGLVPCLDSGKKTRRFKIETANVIRYLADRELHPDRYKPPDGFYERKRVKGKSRRKKRRKQGTDAPSPSVTGVDPCIMREFYEAELEIYPNDVLTTKQISEFTGYSHSSVVRWCNKQYLQNFYIRHRFYVPKEYLLDFFTSRRFINISVKSELHKERNQKLIQYQTEQSSK